MIGVAEEIGKSTKWLWLEIVSVDYGWCCTLGEEFFVIGNLL